MNGEQVTNVIIAILLALILIYYLYNALRTRRKRKPEYAIREVLACMQCNYKLERDYEAGDFIGLLKGKCPKCGGQMKIRGIYAVEKSKL
ncbi:MAG: hypothetical protein ACP5KA_04975 [Desulfurococcaceae archaeon]|jgi:predicted RNA-binding Zn-ribbon protein involved in translation (DUF1610 family)